MRAMDRQRMFEPTAARHAVRAALLTLILAAPSLAQPGVPPPVVESVSLSGPRFGMTLLSSGVVNRLRDYEIQVGPLVSQFGWQFEKQFDTGTSRATLVTEWVLLVGGLEQSAVLPSVSWLVGLRTREGVEFGLGPNITPAGVALAVAGGITLRAGNMNVPVNLAVVPSKAGRRVSLLTGFSLRR